MTKFYDNDVTPKVGSVILADGRRVSECLLAGDSFSSFRFPCNSGFIKSVACEIDVTGRTLQWRDHAFWVRVCITWKGDGEPDTYSGGWMLVK